MKNPCPSISIVCSTILDDRISDILIRRISLRRKFLFELELIHLSRNPTKPKPFPPNRGCRSSRIPFRWTRIRSRDLGMRKDDKEERKKLVLLQYRTVQLKLRPI